MGQCDTGWQAQGKGDVTQPGRGWGVGRTADLTCICNKLEYSRSDIHAEALVFEDKNADKIY